MKLKMLTGLAGVDFLLAPEDETERFSGKEAQRLIDAGYAVPVAEHKAERAVRRPVAETRG